MKRLFFLLAILLVGCATQPSVRPWTMQEVKSYKIDCSKKDYQIYQLNQQLEAQGLPKDLAKMNDSQRMINGYLKSKLWAIRLECK